jgi:hypothetical protein
MALVRPCRTDGCRLWRATLRVGEVADIGIGRHCGGLGLPSFTLKQRFARARAQNSSGKLPSRSLFLSVCVYTRTRAFQQTQLSYFGWRRLAGV